jgi:hypothetical protein
MFRGASSIVSFGLLVGCRHDDPARTLSPPASAPALSSSAIAPASAAPVLAVAPAASASPPPAAASSEPTLGDDFDDMFDYGLIDAGKGDPRALTAPIAYTSYVNARFGFSIEVPKTFVAMPEPTNGDGLQWRIGHDLVMAASGMYATDDHPPFCPRSKNVTAHGETKTSCWATGTRGGYIFWHRERVSRGTSYSLEFQYKEGLKAQMDAIVKHVNASWSI